MFKKLLLASTAGFVVVAGALCAGAAWSQESRFVFRYSAGVLPVAADDVGGSENPDDGDDETGEADPGDDGEDREDEEGGGGDDEPTEPTESDPIGGVVFSSTLRLDDSNGNGFGDVGERLYLRTTVRNVGDEPVTGIRVDYRASLGEQSVISAYNHNIDLEPGQVFEGASPYVLNADALASLARGETFTAFSSLTAAAGESYDFETHAMPASIVPFGVYEPVKPEEITLSSVSAAHLDSDGDGYGDRGELVRVSFSARNTGGLPAQGVSFEIAFPEWPAATAYCDRSSLPAGSSMSCSADVEISRDDLDSFGPPETVVALTGAVSLVALNGEYFTAGEHSTALDEISFIVPPVVYAPHLRIVASEGWAFECVTPWEASFVADHQDMLLTQWSNRAIALAGGKTVAGKTFNLQSTWILVGSVNVTTRTANAYKNSMKSGDTRPAIPSEMPQPCGPGGKFNIVTHGDLTTAYPVDFESVEVVNLPM